MIYSKREGGFFSLPPDKWVYTPGLKTGGYQQLILLPTRPGISHSAFGCNTSSLSSPFSSIYTISAPDNNVRAWQSHENSIDHPLNSLLQLPSQHPILNCCLANNSRQIQLQQVFKKLIFLHYKFLALLHWITMRLFSAILCNEIDTKWQENDYYFYCKQQATYQSETYIIYKWV